MQASRQVRLSKKEGCLDAGVKSDDIFLSVGPPQGRKRSGVVMPLTLENKTEKMRTHRRTARWAVWRAQLGQDRLLCGE